MEIDAKLFWENFEQILQDKSLTLTELCKKASVNYSTFSQNKYRNVYPLISNLIPIATVLGVSLDKLVIGQENLHTAAVNSNINNPRIQAIVSALIASPEKLSAIETLLGMSNQAGQSNLA